MAQTSVVGMRLRILRLRQSIRMWLISGTLIIRFASTHFRSRDALSYDVQHNQLGSIDDNAMPQTPPRALLKRYCKAALTMLIADETGMYITARLIVQCKLFRSRFSN
uniref:Secreted protein n=1 Tax=Panagrellus redivivus TaxID=6233 RepID=A0A7E4ZQ13_PANRE